MERNPADRYPTAAAMKAELDDYEKVELIGRYKTLQAPQAWKNKFPMLPLIAAFFVLQIVVGFGIYFFIKHHAK